MRRFGAGADLIERVSRIVDAPSVADRDEPGPVSVALSAEVQAGLERANAKGPHSGQANFRKRDHSGEAERILTWGDSDNLSFGNTVAGVVFTAANNSTKQLIHVLRERPTSWKVLVTVNLNNGWTGEGAGWNAVISYFVGVGQAKTQFQRVIAFPAAPLDFTQVVADVFELPAQALQVQVAITGTTDQASLHSTTITALCAPFFE